MVTIRSNLDENISKFVYKSIQDPLDELCACYACAGIRNNKDAAKKARGNHYGEYFIDDNGRIVMIPVRQFIWAAIKDIDSSGNVGFTSEEIKYMLTRKINSNPRVQKKHLVGTKRVSGADGQPSPIYKDIRHTDQWALPVIKGNNFDGLFEKLAKRMSERLKAAIMSVDIVGSYKPRVEGTRKFSWKGEERDIRHNAPSTIKRKGKDHPLVASGEMVSSIEGWTSGEDRN